METILRKSRTAGFLPLARNLFIFLSWLIHYIHSYKLNDASFVLKKPPCYAELPIYSITVVTSRTSCAIVCLKDEFNFCDKFLWDPVDGKCMLHSKSKKSSYTAKIEAGWKMYRRITRKACNITGYHYHSIGNACYKLHRVKKTWMNSQLICQGDGGNLATITNNDTRDFLFDMAACNYRFWIGLTNGSWLNGQGFDYQLFGPKTRLDNNDADITNDTDNSCGVLVTRTDEIWVIDNSCYIKQRNFFCESENTV